VHDYLLQTTWTNHYDETNQITQQNSNHICYTIFYRFRALLGPLPATTTREIIEIPQPNWHLFYFSSSNFTVQDRILSSTGDALTQVNG
jgi:hypothetical protein